MEGALVVPFGRIKSHCDEVRALFKARGLAYLMGMTSTRRILTSLAAALVALQALWSGIAATAYAAGVDEARFMCAQLALPAEARAQLAELAALVDGHEAPDPAFDLNECPSCSLAKTPALAATVVAAPGEMLRSSHRQIGLFADAVGHRQTTGPPVGLRAPPVSL